MVRFAILTLVCGVLSLLQRELPWRPLAGGLQALVFLLLGLGHLRYIGRREPEQAPAFSPAAWMSTLLVTLEILLLLTLLYGFLPAGRLSMAIASGCMFLFPFTVANAWLVWGSIPEKRFLVWFIPRQWGNFVLPQGKPLSVKLKVRVRYFDPFEELIQLDVADRIHVGRLFAYIAGESKKVGMRAIEMEDENHESYGWQFYYRRLGAGKYLDPQWTLRESKVGKRGVIVVRRIRREMGTNINNQSGVK